MTDWKEKQRIAAKSRTYRLRRKAAGAPYDPSTGARVPISRSRFGARVHIPALDGCVFVTSDAHYWRGEPSLAHRAAVRLAHLLKPFAIVNNGGVLTATNTGNGLVTINSDATGAVTVTNTGNGKVTVNATGAAAITITHTGNEDYTYPIA